MPDEGQSLRHANRTKFLANHRPSGGVKPNHTRMPSAEGCKPKVHGGSFLIEKESEDEFHTHYFNEVVQNGDLEYLTEKQLGEGGPVAVDLDFRFEPEIRERQHNGADIINIVEMYIDALKTIFTFIAGKAFMIYVFEKPNVNTSDDEVTKDGIHIIIGLQMSSVLQVILRDKVLEQFKLNPNNFDIIDDLPLKETCTWEKVLDDGISKGTTNWTLYGSRKPNHEAYQITSAYNMTFDDADGEFSMEEWPIECYHRDIEEFKKLSVRYRDHPKFELTPEAARLLEAKQRSKKGGRVLNKSGSNGRLNVISRAQISPGITDASTLVNMDQITTKSQLEAWQSCVERELDKSPKEFKTRDIHRYALTLPDRFYGDGSYTEWIQLAFALKNTDDRLFITWVLVSAKKIGFDYGCIGGLYDQWHKIDKREDGKTGRSVMYWAQMYNKEGFNQVKGTSLDYYVMISLDHENDREIAQVLYQMCNERFVCTGNLGNHTSEWHEFVRHRWTTDKGMRIRKTGISEDLHDIYDSKQTELNETLQTLVDGERLNNTEPDTNANNAYDRVGRHIKNAAKIMVRCHSQMKKTSIEKEAAEIFWDGDFDDMLDQNKWTLGFDNGVMNLQTGEFRDGRPLDYISKTTGVSYVSESDMDSDENRLIHTQIVKFMTELFPDAELCEYMWEHLASTLVGANMSQCFNIYKGDGSNGKSLISTLMSKSLGDYCSPATPINIITTAKRHQVGGASPELMALKGIRYVVFQEVTKGMTLNEGVMKEMVGDAKISGRALYKDHQTFDAMFSMAVCTNSLFEIKSNDYGTWRRLRIVEFKSCFKDPEVYAALPEEERNNKYIFPKDHGLEERLDVWAPVFASLLVRRCIKNKGLSATCPMVVAETDRYRLRQDLIGQFMEENLRVCADQTLTKGTVNQAWKQWVEDNGHTSAPKACELHECVNKKYNKRGTAWVDVEIIYTPPPDSLPVIYGED
jgi:P4 family phage/plasmid primase-like protien